jgi:hypothetical protein
MMRYSADMVNVPRGTIVTTDTVVERVLQIISLVCDSRHANAGLAVA